MKYSHSYDLNTGTQIVLIRRVLGVKQYEFAEALGITKQTLSALENDKVVLTTEIGLRFYFLLTNLLAENDNTSKLDDNQKFVIKKFIEDVLKPCIYKSVKREIPS